MAVCKTLQHLANEHMQSKRRTSSFSFLHVLQATASPVSHLGFRSSFPESSLRALHAPFGEAETRQPSRTRNSSQIRARTNHCRWVL